MKSATPASRTGWRRALKIIGAIGAGLVVLLVALPVWFPWVLRPALRSYGIQFGTYERLSYARFRVSDVKAQFPRVTLEARRFEAALPLAWLSRPAAEDPPNVLVSDWTLRKSAAPPRSRKTNSLFSVLDSVENSFALLRRWVPSAVLTNGAVEIGTKIALPAVEWRGGTLKGIVLPARFGEPLAVAANVSTSANYLATIRLRAQDAAVQFQLLRTTNEWALSGIASWQTNRADITARTDREGQWPDEALLKAERVRLPAQVLGVRGYDDFQGSVILSWQSDRFLLEVTGSAEPEQPATHLPPLMVDLRARGTTASATVERLRIAAPWLQSDLSAPVTIGREGKLLGDAASLSLAGDFDKFPWLKMTGKMRGTVNIMHTGREYPKATFDLMGEELRARDVTAKLTRVTGVFIWPIVTFSDAKVTFDDGSAVSAAMQFDVQRRSVSNGSWQFNGGFLHRFLPADIHYAELTANGECSGALTNLTHAGQLRATEVKVPNLRPLRCDVNWRGQSLNLTQAQATIQAGRSQLHLGGAFQFGGTGRPAVQRASRPANSHEPIVVTLQTFMLRREDRLLYELETPCAIDFSRRDGRPAAFDLSVEAFRWSGPDRNLLLAGAITWPEQGQLQLKARRLAEQDFLDFLESPPRGITISDLDLEAKWTNSPVAFRIALSGELAGDEDPLVESSPSANSRGDSPSPLNRERAGVRGAIAQDADPPLTPPRRGTNSPLTSPRRGTTHSALLPSSEGLGVGSGAQGASTVRRVLSPLRGEERQAAAAPASRSALSVRANVTGDASGVTFQPVEITSQVAPMLRVQGTAPFALVPSNGTNWLRVDEQRPFALRASLDKTEQASYGLGAKGKAVLRHPALDLAIRGTAAKPEGHLHFRASSVEWRSATNEAELVKFEDLALEAVADRNRFTLQKLTMAVEGQPVSANAQWPIESQSWKDLVTKRRLPDWRKATARLQIRDAAIAPLAQLAPKVLRPEGRLTVELSVLPGARLDGYLTITNAATRPLATLTPIHDIGARVEFRNQTATLERFEGDFGGQPIRLSGRGWLTEEGQPRFAVELRGSNVTLVRKSGLLLRGDVDVRLAQEQATPPKLSGRVKLHDGLFLLPVASLMPGHVSVQKPGPAAVGVTNEPFADWQIDVEITGNEFLRARTPLFTGVMSVDAHVQGKLAAPATTGDMRINWGRVRFPFGTLTVEQGYLNLSGDIAGSEIFMTAAGRNYNYNIRMEVKGGLEEPAVTFSSAPPLASEQILLMLSAGEIPHDEYQLSTGSKVSKLASFVGKDLLSRWRGDDGSEERLTIRSAEDISEAGKTTYSVEYRLTDRWSLVGEYDRFSAFNAGVKWKVISR